MHTTTNDAAELHHGDAWLRSCDPQFYASDEFATTYQKVVVCPKRQPHSWVDCPFAHIGEKAKRRDLRFFTYTSELCQEAKRNVACPRGDACSKSHHVYESWLHPQLYRTRMCAAGTLCMRPVCFFAHTKEQLRQPSKPFRARAGAQLTATAAAAAAGAAGGAAVASTSAAASAARVLSPQPMQQQQQVALPSALVSTLAALALSPGDSRAAAYSSPRAASPAAGSGSAAAVPLGVAGKEAASAEVEKRRRSIRQLPVQRPPPQHFGSSSIPVSHSHGQLLRHLSHSPAAASAADAAAGSSAGANWQNCSANNMRSRQQQLGAALHAAWATSSGDVLQLRAAELAAAVDACGSTADVAAGSVRATGNASQEQLLLLQQQVQQMLQHSHPAAAAVAAGSVTNWPQDMAPSSSRMEGSTVPFHMLPVTAAQFPSAAIAAAVAAATAPAGVQLQGDGLGMGQDEMGHFQQQAALEQAAAAAAMQQLQQQQHGQPSAHFSVAHLAGAQQVYLQSQGAAAAQHLQQQQQQAWQGLLHAELQELVPTGLPVNTTGFATHQQQQAAYVAAAGMTGLRPVAQNNSTGYAQDLLAGAQLAAAQQQQQLLLMAAAASDPAAAAALAAMATGDAESTRAAALHLWQYGCSQQ